MHFQYIQHYTQTMTQRVCEKRMSDANKNLLIEIVSLRVYTAAVCFESNI